MHTTDKVMHLDSVIRIIEIRTRYLGSIEKQHKESSPEAYNQLNKEGIKAEMVLLKGLVT